MTEAGTRLVLRYDEVALKGANRRWFVGRLAAAVRAVFTGGAGVVVSPVRGRIDVRVPASFDVADAVERLRHVFGVATIARAWDVPLEPGPMADAVLAQLPTRAPASFRVRVSRVDKAYPLSSPEVERLVGARIHQARGWPVRLKGAALDVSIEIARGGAGCAIVAARGPGGLPVGTGGRVLALLSGGVDSALAAWRMMRRGCRVDAVHLHAMPLTSDASERAVANAAAFLARGQEHTRLTLVPLVEIQKHIATVAPPPLRTVLYRRAMLRVAASMARRSGAHALVTGDALGQVASQTLENLVTIDEASSLPVLRPLIGYDKREVVDEARRWNLPAPVVAADEDCCRLFAPLAAAIRSSTAGCAAIETEVPMRELIDVAVASSVRRVVEADWTMRKA